jgi:ubiquinone/menaquinone biosynthesis C-methylase UbiE
MAHSHHDTARPAGYVPAAGRDWLLPLYDPALRWLMREDVFKRRLVREAAIRPGDRVLDLGCGTGTLTLLLAQLHPESRVTGVDGDSLALSVARRKATKAGASISFDQGLATELPYPEASFDRVVSSLMLHHLEHDDKLRALAEVRRVLRPGGTLNVVDFGPPSTRFARLLVHLAHRTERVHENLEGRLPELFEQADLERVEVPGKHDTAFGTLVFYRGHKGP